MITHEEARKELRWVDVVSSNNLLSNYISQQEKVSKLLGLYKQYYNKIPIGTSMYKLEQQIEKLEKELREMK